MYEKLVVPGVADAWVTEQWEDGAEGVADRDPGSAHISLPLHRVRPIERSGHISASGPQVHIYKEYHSVCPFVGIGTLPSPLSPASVPPQNQRGEGAHSPAGEGLGESQFRRMEKKHSTLTTLWSGQNGTENLAQRALNDLWRAWLSRGLMIWLLAHPSPPSPVSKFDRRRTGRLGKKDYFSDGRGREGGGRGVESYDSKKA